MLQPAPIKIYSKPLLIRLPEAVGDIRSGKGGVVFKISPISSPSAGRIRRIPRFLIDTNKFQDSEEGTEYLVLINNRL